MTGEQRKEASAVSGHQRERPPCPGALGDNDQGHESEDDETRCDHLGAQNAHVNRDAAGKCESERCEQRDPPVTHDQADKPCEGCDEERRY